MNKQELKQLIIESIKEFQLEGHGVVNKHHRFTLNKIKQDNEKIKNEKYRWKVDDWEDRKKGLIRLIRTNPKDSFKIDVATIDRDGNFVIKK